MGTEQPSPTGVSETFIENILRLNKGKIGTFYFTYQGNTQWNAKTYQGIVETASPDHIIISDPATGIRYMLLMANLDWVEFAQEISYFVPETPVPQTTR
jgi:spore germination protein Q